VPDPASLTELGLWGLFVASFLAGSILPFASEVVLAGVLLLGVSAGAAVSVATLGNVLGALTLYALGRIVVARPPGKENSLVERLLSRFTTEDPVRLEKARGRLERWGPVALLAAWVPLVGDALVLAAGLLRLPLGRVTLYTTLGKAGRYATLAAALSAASQ